MSLSLLSSADLLNLATEQVRRGDMPAAHALLTEACGRPNSLAAAHFLHASLCAQSGEMVAAAHAFALAIDRDPGMHIARFQYGLLSLTEGRAGEALDIWAPLAVLSEDHPLACFRQGLVHLIRDEFDPAVHWLRVGIAVNSEFPALSADMAKIIDRIDSRDAAPPKAEERLEAGEAELNPLFLAAYAKDQLH